jgi:PAS domain S-box-containing protein
VTDAKIQTNDFIESLPALVWMADADGSIIYFNRQWYEFTGQSQQESMGLGWENCCHAEDLPNLRRLWKNAIDTGKPFEAEIRIKSQADGCYRWFLFKAQAITNSRGHVTQWLGLFSDIEKHGQHRVEVLQKELVHSRNAAQAANLAKSAFLANMSHEIRTPLGAILGFSELMMQKDQSPTELWNSICTIKRNGEHLYNLVSEILDLSKIEADKLEIENVSFELREILNHVKELLQYRAQEKGISLHFNIDNAVPGTVRTDPTRLKQVLLNIIGNAIKFTSKGGVEVRVSFQAPYLRFNIVDTGIGIPQDHQDRLFKPFSQSDNSMNRRFGGTGLGLSLSKKLAKALGGDVILARSEVNVGSHFVIMINAGVTQSSTADLTSHRTASILAAQKKSFRNLKLLLVDDSTDNLNLIRSILRPTEIQVTTAENGNEAVDKALEGDFDLVIMDIQMPQMDGFQATQALRKAGFRKPIVALTAHALKQDRELAFRAGFDDYLTKPINRSVLHDTIAHYSAKIRKSGVSYLAASI